MLLLGLLVILTGVTDCAKRDIKEKDNTDNKPEHQQINQETLRKELCSLCFGPLDTFLAPLNVSMRTKARIVHSTIKKVKLHSYSITS